MLSSGRRHPERDPPEFLLIKILKSRHLNSHAALFLGDARALVSPHPRIVQLMALQDRPHQVVCSFPSRRLAVVAVGVDHDFGTILDRRPVEIPVVRTIPGAHLLAPLRRPRRITDPNPKYYRSTSAANPVAVDPTMSTTTMQTMNTSSLPGSCPGIRPSRFFFSTLDEERKLLPSKCVGTSPHRQR